MKKGNLVIESYLKLKKEIRNSNNISMNAN